MDKLEAVTAELAAKLAAEYHRNRTARAVQMRHAADGPRLGALWWRGGPDDAVVTMQSGRHRLTYSVADWQRFGWTIEGIDWPP